MNPVTPDRFDPRHPFRRIADDLRGEIESGSLPPGSRLPTIKALAERYDVANETARQAIQRLKGAGLVETHQGLGAFVRRYQPYEWWPGEFEHRAHRGDQPGSEYDAWAVTVAGVGRKPRQEVTVDQVVPPTVVAHQFQTAPDEIVAVRYRTRYVDSLPIQTADSYYPMWVARGTPILEEPGDVAIPGGLLAAVGHEQVRFDDTLTVRMPTTWDQRRLDLPATGTPVAEHVRAGYDADDRLVRVIITVLPADRNVIRWKVVAR